jgi:tRNA/rRNA methyltransferase
MPSKFITQISTRFVLINTIKNDNIGSAARALKTMGFDSLILVNPHGTKIHHCNKAKRRASGAIDVLRNAIIYTDLDEATQGCDLICGTGMPVDMHRKRRERNYVEPRVYFDKLLNDTTTVTTDLRSIDDTQQNQFSIAFLFGCETTGMSEEDMDKCQVMLGIPTNPQFGSLNLANAVQIIAYDWRMALGGSDSYMD